jgi:large subunit ribosomal protein L9
MKVILIKNHKGLGVNGEIKEVLEGFAQNFLFPNKIAILATKEEIRKIEKNKIEAVKKVETKNKLLESQLSKINGQTIIFNKKVNSVGGLFSSLQRTEIKEQIKDVLGVSIPETMIEETHDMKHTGEYKIKIGNSINNFKYYVVVKVIGQ